MSDIRTFKASGVGAYASLLGLIESIANECGTMLSEDLQPDYKHGHRFSIQQSVDLTSTGAQVGYRSEFDPVVVPGWTLQTAPFFISDPRSHVCKGIPAAVFVMGQSYLSEKIDSGYLARRGPNARQWPSAEKLGLVYNELRVIQMYKP